MKAHSEELKYKLNKILPFNRNGNNRPAWFLGVSRRTGLPAKRLRTIFYNREASVWPSEVELINQAYIKATINHETKVEEAISANVERCLRRADLAEAKKEMWGDIQSTIERRVITVIREELSHFDSLGRTKRDRISR